MFATQECLGVLAGFYVANSIGFSLCVQVSVVQVSDIRHAGNGQRGTRPRRAANE
jgi:hypothetical protein